VHVEKAECIKTNFEKEMTYTSIIPTVQIGQIRNSSGRLPATLLACTLDAVDLLSLYPSLLQEYLQELPCASISQLACSPSHKLREKEQMLFNVRQIPYHNTLA
jgi:hypothetical protein